MRKGKRPNKKQKILMKKYKLDYNNWLVTKIGSDHILVEHRHIGTVRKLMTREL